MDIENDTNIYKVIARIKKELVVMLMTLTMDYKRMETLMTTCSWIARSLADHNIVALAI